MPVKVERKLKLFAYEVTHRDGNAAGQLQAYTKDEVEAKLAEDYPESEFVNKPYKMLSGEEVPAEQNPENSGKLFDVKITVTEIK